MGGSPGEVSVHSVQIDSKGSVRSTTRLLIHDGAVARRDLESDGLDTPGRPLSKEKMMPARKARKWLLHGLLGCKLLCCGAILLEDDEDHEAARKLPGSMHSV